LLLCRVGFDSLLPSVNPHPNANILLIKLDFFETSLHLVLSPSRRVRE
jgi:hypothetical protein